MQHKPGGVFGRVLYEHRVAAGLTQEELAALAGLSVRTVSDIERGRTSRPYRNSVGLLADALRLAGGARAEFQSAARSDGSVVAHASGPHAGQGPLSGPQITRHGRSWPGDSAQDLRGTGQPLSASSRWRPFVPRQLPAAVPHFVGRVKELAMLNELPDQAYGTSGTLVITAIGGTAGVGKTALAVHCAHLIADRFPDGQLFVNLRGVGDSPPMTPAEVIRGFLDALQVPLGRIPASPEAQAGLYRSLLAGKRMLVLLDSARDADQVRPLLPGSASCLVVVTSRHQLGGLAVTEGAREISLDVFTEEEARDLLALRLGMQRLVSEPEAVRRLTELTARLPLALSIAAARAAGHPSFRLATVAAELGDARSRLDVLDAGDAASSVRAVFSWSYRSLNGPAARMFRLLGLHPGPDVSASAAASLAGIPLAQARHALSRLTSAHLLAEHAPGRYAFHDLLREYAAEQARDNEDRTALHRVLDHYLHSARAADRLLDPAREPHPLTVAAPQPGVTPEQFGSFDDAMAWFEAERRVLLASIALAADAQLGTHTWQLPWELTTYFRRRGRREEWAAVQHTALTAVQRIKDAAGQAYALADLGRASVRLGSYADASIQLGQALQLFEEMDDPVGLARCHIEIGRLLRMQTRYREAVDHAEQAMELFRSTGHRTGQAGALNNAGWYFSLLGDHREALIRCQEALALFGELADRDGEGVTSDSLGHIYHQLGQFPEAAARYQHSLELCRQTGDYYNQAHALSQLGSVHKDAGEYAAAREAWQRALVILDGLDYSAADDIRVKLRRLDQEFPRDEKAKRQPSDGKEDTGHRHPPAGS